MPAGTRTEKQDTDGESKHAANPQDIEEIDPSDGSAPAHDAGTDTDNRRRHRGIRWGRGLAYGALPGLALTVAMAAGYLKWWDASIRVSHLAGLASVQAATDSTIAMLSYRPDTVERDLDAATDRLTGEFKDSYTSFTHDVVIPGSRQQQISAMASVPASASVSASANHAVVLLFVNQTVTVGAGPPTDTASRVRATLDKVDGRWLISGFDPL
ncbi:hypothetical protein [Mycolicibacter sinensis]